jgi:prepilin-type N-terminal cleavage/methylation domain-containing protein
MKPIPFSVNSDEGGFTLLELLVAMGLSAIIFGLFAQTLVMQSTYFVQDIARTRIQQNIRGALDIISMNVRQAGESLDSDFPALLVTNGTNDVLTLRRNLVQDVLNVCNTAAAGATQINVSDSSSGQSECLPVNVASTVSTWSNYRLGEGGSTTIYIYDRVAEVGEFLEYDGESTSSLADYLSVSETVNEYPEGSSSIYILEEFRFSLDASSKTLRLTLNNETTTPMDVAYAISAFQVELTMKDGSTLTSLAVGDSNTWKDIRAVRISMSGEEKARKQVFTRTVSGEYFPRNVLSD